MGNTGIQNSLAMKVGWERVLNALSAMCKLGVALR